MTQVLSDRKDRHCLVVTKDHWSLQIFSPFGLALCPLMILTRSSRGWVLTGLELHIREADIPWRVALEERCARPIKQEVLVPVAPGTRECVCCPRTGALLGVEVAVSSRRQPAVPPSLLLSPSSPS